MSPLARGATDQQPFPLRPSCAVYRFQLSCSPRTIRASEKQANSFLVRSSYLILSEAPTGPVGIGRSSEMSKPPRRLIRVKTLFPPSQTSFAPASARRMMPLNLPPSVLAMTWPDALNWIAFPLRRPANNLPSWVANRLRVPSGIDANSVHLP